MVHSIKPLIEERTKDFLSTDTIFHSDALKIPHVKHIVFPEIFQKNYLEIKKNFSSENFEVYLACKSTYSKSLIQKAKSEGLGIEVSSLNELHLAQELGFEKIIAGGPKNATYLSEAIKAHCIISVDSVFELESIIASSSKAHVLLRISDPSAQSRNIAIKVSRFGISKRDLDLVLEKIKKSSLVSLKGFHFHADGYDSDMKREFAFYFIDLLLRLRKEGFNDLERVNIGGAFRTPILQDRKEWFDFVNDLEKSLVHNCDLEVWGDYTYGLSVSDKGNIIGRSLAESKGDKNDIVTELHNILNVRISDDIDSIKTLLFENNIKLIIEPGFSLSTTAGITVIDVVGVKEGPCQCKLIQVNGHLFSISSNMLEHLSDPLLVPLHKSSEGESFEGYIIGSLCREDDFIMKRKVLFSQEPKPGDKLVFFNTGSYAMSYERCNPQRYEEAQYFFAEKINNSWVIKNDN